MSGILQILQWIKEDTPIHRLDPRSKMVWAFCVMIMIIMIWDPIILTLLTLSLIPFVVLGKATSRLLIALKSMVFFTVILGVLEILYYGWFFGIIATAKFILATSIFSIFFLTTHIDDFAAALSSLGIPFEFTFILVTSAKYIPVLFWEIQDITDAYKARGIELEKSMLQKIRSYAAMLVPLFIVSTRRALTMAEAMEARAFGYQKKRTTYRQLKMHLADYFLIAMSVVLSIGVIVLLYV
jgi:energy-coupling factor transport system permease protein